MKRWEVILIFGRDKDDWEKEEFNAPDYDTAMSIAMELAGRSYNVHKLKEIPNPNTMEQTKIQNLTPQGTFEAQGKTFYKFDCILENGMIGEVNALSADKWKVGDEVVIKEHLQTKWGPRLKLDKPGFTPGGSRKQDPDDKIGMIASWAVGVAMQVVGDPTQNHYEEAVLLASRIALRCRGIIKQEVEP
jgi:hypothetical protein